MVESFFKLAAGGVAIPHAPHFGSTASKIKHNISEAQQAEPESLNPLARRLVSAKQCEDGSEAETAQPFRRRRDLAKKRTTRNRLNV